MRLQHLFACATLSALSCAVAAADINPAAQRLAASCAGCHGTNGAAVGTAIPALAGQPKEALLAAMQEFKNGTRQATVMHQLAKGYTDEQIALMAAYFAQQAAPAK